MRMFVSVDLPERLADAVEAVQADFEPADGLRMVDPEQAHLTLKFLGDVQDDAAPEVVDGLETAVAAAEVPPFDATIRGLGVFPSFEYISVVWLGIGEGADALTALHDAVETELVERGFEPSEHEFTPHVTIARMDHAGGKELVQDLVSERDPIVGTMSVEAIHLTESTLTPDGPVYETYASVPLFDD